MDRKTWGVVIVECQWWEMQVNGKRYNAVSVIQCGSGIEDSGGNRETYSRKNEAGSEWRRGAWWMVDGNTDGMMG